MPRMMTKEAVEQIEDLLAKISDQTAVGRALGIAASTVRKVARGEHAHQRQATVDLGLKTPRYLPSPEEIEAACCEIRESWPAEEQEPWYPPGAENRPVLGTESVQTHRWEDEPRANLPGG